MTPLKPLIYLHLCNLWLYMDVSRLHKVVYLKSATNPYTVGVAGCCDF